MQLAKRGPASLSRPALKAAVQPARRVVVCAKEENGATSSPMDLEELSDIIRLVNNTDIVELELKSKKFNLSVKKKEALVQQVVTQVVAAPAAAPVAVAAPAAAAPAPAPAAPARAAAPAPAAAKPAAAAPAKLDGLEVKSPMAGTFYHTPAPGEPAFVKVGDRVKKGQTVGIIEAMKLMNEIECDVSGEVVKFLVDNGKSVVPGQPLVLIKP